jgi:hypothetical protein
VHDRHKQPLAEVNEGTLQNAARAIDAQSIPAIAVEKAQAKPAFIVVDAASTHVRDRASA